MRDIHDYAKRLEQALVRVKKSQLIVPADKELLERFSWVLRGQKVSTGRVAKYVNHLKIAAQMLPTLTKSRRGLAEATDVLDSNVGVLLFLIVSGRKELVQLRSENWRPWKNPFR